MFWHQPNTVASSPPCINQSTNANMVNTQGLSGLKAILGVTAFILMWIGSFRCDFVKFPVTTAGAQSFDMQLGMWSFEYVSILISGGGSYLFQSCNTYTDGVTMDASWKAARAFSVIAFIFGIAMLVAACVSACAQCNSQRPNFDLTYGWEAPGYLLTALFQGLTLLLLSSNACSSGVISQLQINTIGWDVATTCSMSTGAKLAISSMSLWFAASVSSFLAHKAEKAEISSQEEDTDLNEPLVPHEVL